MKETFEIGNRVEVKNIGQTGFIKDITKIRGTLKIAVELDDKTIPIKWYGMSHLNKLPITPKGKDE
jgi:hypothetical protein